MAVSVRFQVRTMRRRGRTAQMPHENNVFLVIGDKGKEGSGLLQHPIVLPSCVQVNEGISPLRLYEKLWLKVMIADFL